MRELIGAERRHMNPFKAQRKVRKKDHSFLKNTGFRGMFRWRKY